MPSLDELKIELENLRLLSETNADSEMKKLRDKANKQIRETSKRLDITKESSLMFKVENVDDASTMDKYSHRIFESVNNTIESITKPEKITLRSLELFSNITRAAFSEQDEILIKYVKLMKDSKYKKRVNNLSKSLKKWNSEMTKLERFVSENYAPNAEIESISLIIGDIIEQMDDYQAYHLQLLEKEDEIKIKDNNIKEIVEELEKLENHESKKASNAANEEYKVLYKELDNEFTNIRKAIRKYENIMSKAKNKPDLTLAKELVKDVTNCLAKQGSLGTIERLLSLILEELNQNNLKLKRDKREATKLDIEKLLSGELNTYWNKSKDVVNRKRSTADQLIELQLDAEENKVKITLDAAKRDRNRIFERELRSLQSSISDLEKSLSEVEDKIQTYIDSSVNLSFDLLELPEWAILYE